MPRLIKTAGAYPSKYRGMIESGKQTGPLYKVDSAEKTIASIMNLTGAAMKHPVTDLIVTGIDAAVRSGEEDVSGFQDLLDARSDATKRRAAESRTQKTRPSGMPAPSAGVVDMSGATSKTLPEQFIKGVTDYTGEVAASMGQPQPQPPLDAQPQPQDIPRRPETMAETERRWRKEGGEAPAPQATKAPRGFSEIISFVSHPLATPEDLDWALRQMSRFTPVTSVSEIGKTQTKYATAIMNAFAQGKKRVPTEIELRKARLGEAKEARKASKSERDRGQAATFKAVDAALALKRIKASEKNARISALRAAAGDDSKRQELVGVLNALAELHPALMAVNEKIKNGQPLTREDREVARNAKLLQRNLNKATTGPSFQTSGLRPEAAKIWKGMMSKKGYELYDIAQKNQHPRYMLGLLNTVGSEFGREEAAQEKAKEKAASAKAQAEKSMKNAQRNLEKAQRKVNNLEDVFVDVNGNIKQNYRAYIEKRGGVFSLKKGIEGLDRRKFKPAKRALTAYKAALVEQDNAQSAFDDANADLNKLNK
jgi:hypothetical protein